MSASGTWTSGMYALGGSHHDGTNTVLYRYVDTEKRAYDIMNKIACGGMNLKQFKKATKSIRPFVQKVYGID